MKINKSFASNSTYPFKTSGRNKATNKVEKNDMPAPGEYDIRGCFTPGKYYQPHYKIFQFMKFKVN